MLPPRSFARRHIAPAAPDFLDHNAVVEISLAVDCEQRKLLACALRLLKHEVDILEVLDDATLGSEIAAHHLFALDIHHLRIRRATARHIEKGFGIKPEALGENEPLGKRQPIEPENQIDRELGPSRVTELADVKP